MSIIAAKKRQTLLDCSNQKGIFGYFSWNRLKLDCRGKLRTTLPVDSIMSLYLSLETGKFGFPGQVFNREVQNGHVGFMLSCYDAELCYDSRADNFRARFSAEGRATVEHDIEWNRLRASAVDTPAHSLHLSDCLDDLKPGDHIEIQWRWNIEFPYGWWYGVVGHSEPCDGCKLHCQCHSSGTNQVQKTGTDVLLDLLSIGTPPAQSSLSTLYGISSTQDNNTSKGALERLSSPSVQSVQASSPVMDLLDGFGPSEQMCEDSGPACPSIVVFESSHLRMMFNFSKQPGNLQATFIEANFLNKSSDVYTDSIFQAAVPKFLQLHLDLASSNSLPASEEGSITQKLRVTNSQHDKDCTSITSSGVCKIFGSRCCIPLFELDFSAAPFVFLYLHSNLLLSSAIYQSAFQISDSLVYILWM